MSFGVSISDVAAVLALILSAYAVWTTSKFNKRQLSLIDIQEQLNKRQLEQGDSQALEARKADVGATLVKLGSSKYRVKIFNRGKAAARQVRIEFPNGNNIVPEEEITGKFPMEVLEQHQSVELIAAFHMSTAPKQSIMLRWSDDHADENEKVVYLTR